MTTSTDLKTFKIAKGTKAQIVTAYNNGDIGDTDFAIATDEDYADIDLSNISNTGKTTVIGWGMPDYSAGVSKSWNTSVQADKDGWVYVKGAGNTDESSYVLEISTNGSTWVRTASMYAYSSNTTGGVLIPVPKGTYYKASQSPSTSARVLTFYPCKGA